MLDTGNPEALHTRAIDCALPRCEFFQRQIVSFADFVDGQQAAIDRRHQRVVPGAGNEASVSGSPSGPTTIAGRIFWFSIIIFLDRRHALDQQCQSLCHAALCHLLNH
jgi:hypothetical protein